jgi:hypothetical protein
MTEQQSQLTYIGMWLELVNLKSYQGVFFNAGLKTVNDLLGLSESQY